jgi:hypothetical protein
MADRFSARRRDSSRCRSLVYTSAGDRSEIERWLSPGATRPFDTWISYYGAIPGRYRGLGEYYQQRSGGKFPNLANDYRCHPEIFRRYDAVFVPDDDIRISARSIAGLFDLRTQYDLWLLQPAFSPRGQISHPITRMRAEAKIRFTNFIEVTCPLFRGDKLELFLSHYDPSLVGWGVDWWFCELIGGGSACKIAIADQIPCVNPLTRRKGGGPREIDRLQPVEERMRAWEGVKLRHHLVGERAGYVTFGEVRRSMLARQINGVRLLLDSALGVSTRLRRRLRASAAQIKWLGRLGRWTA